MSGDLGKHRLIADGRGRPVRCTCGAVLQGPNPDDLYAEHIARVALAPLGLPSPFPAGPASPTATIRDDGAYTAGPPDDGRPVSEHLDELIAGKPAAPTAALVEAAQAFNRARKLLETTEDCPHCDDDYSIYCKVHAAIPGYVRTARAELFKAVHAIGEAPKTDAAPTFAFQPERVLATCPECGTLCAPQGRVRVVASFECTACGTAWSTGTI